MGPAAASGLPAIEPAPPGPRGPHPAQLDSDAQPPPDAVLPTLSSSALLSVSTSVMSPMTLRYGWWPFLLSALRDVLQGLLGPMVREQQPDIES